jgi:hypothetical protein
MSRTFVLPVICAGLLALMGGSVATQQQPPLPPGFVDPKPLLDAAVKAIGNDKLNCVTISGTGYNGAVGQQKEAGINVDWPRPDALNNYTRTMNWQAKTMKEEFDRKPGLTPAAWKYGIGWIDGPLATQAHQIFMLNASGPKVYAWHMDGANGQPVPNEPDVAAVFPVELCGGGSLARWAVTARPSFPRSPTSSRSPPRADSRSTRRSTRSTCSSACTRSWPMNSSAT